LHTLNGATQRGRWTDGTDHGMAPTCRHPRLPTQAGVVPQPQGTTSRVLHVPVCHTGVSLPTCSPVSITVSQFITERRRGSRGRGKQRWVRRGWLGPLGREEARAVTTCDRARRDRDRDRDRRVERDRPARLDPGNRDTAASVAKRLKPRDKDHIYV
jgi:hypothetical protein